MSTISIEIKQLSTGYKSKGNDRIVSSRLNATLPIGEMICLLGPNGAGKSTLLRTLAGFQPAIEGNVYVMGRAIQEYRSRELAQLISVVLTDNTGMRNMTVEEVVSMGRSPYTGFWGRLSSKDRTMVKKCMTWVGIENLANRKMQTLSDGERQKVMIAKAIAQETPIIFLDEPTAYLDYPSKIAMMLLLHRLAKALRKTIFMSTHDLEHALQVADQIWLLDSEHGLTAGAPEDLCIDGSIERYFVHDGISFDRKECSFTIAHETARDIVVSGPTDSLDYHLCCKALARNGIKAVVSTAETQAHPDVAIRVPGDGTFRLLECQKETICVNKIDHLLHTIVPAITKHQISAIREAAEMNVYE